MQRNFLSDGLDTHELHRGNKIFENFFTSGNAASLEGKEQRLFEMKKKNNSKSKAAIRGLSQQDLLRQLQQH